MSERDALLILNAVGGIGSLRLEKLIEHFGSALEIIVAGEADLIASNLLPQKVVSTLINFPKKEFLQKEKDLIQKHNVSIVTFQDDIYPDLLKEIASFPIVLYVKGNVDVLENTSLAIVGSRKASVYGTSIAYQFASRLVELDLCVVSGMALGIDTFAHKGSLMSRGKTVAVLGCGLAINYPRVNRFLKEDVCVDGALVSEFPMQSEPLSYNFPRRNRIISGLSLGTIVVEAAQRSGALITADFALEQGREVYAVPGKVDMPTARGVNSLIKQGAKLITCVEDVIEDLSLQIINSSEQNIARTEECFDSEVEGLGLEEKDLFEKIRKKPIHINELILECNSINRVSSILFDFEMKGIVKQLPGKYYIRR